MLFWLLAPAPRDAAPPLNRLPSVRQAFIGTLVDIDTEPASQLRWRIHKAGSLRDLWHLRPEIYGVVGVARSEFEAEQRVSQLNEYFPTRAPRPHLPAA